MVWRWRGFYIDADGIAETTRFDAVLTPMELPEPRVFVFDGKRQEKEVPEPRFVSKVETSGSKPCCVEGVRARV